MTILQAAILAIVQGLTEFLPVSSSGHMVLVKSLLGLKSDGVVWEVALHIGTLAAVVIIFHKDIFQIISGFLGGLLEAFRNGWAKAWKERPDYRMGWYLIAATIPAGLLGFLLNDWIETLFQSPFASAAFLFVTGEILWLTKPHSLIPPGRKMRFSDSLVIGLAQAVAILPGISRSGMTISAGVLRDVDRETAARFSFLLSIPVILGAGLLEAIKFRDLPQDQLGIIGIGMAISAVTGSLALLILLRMVRAGKLHVFSWYCWGMSLISLGYFWRLAVA